MNAWDKFKIGQKVKLTAKAIAAHVGPKAVRTGTVCGYGWEDYLIRVKLNNAKQTTYTYHMDFWTRIK